MNRIQKTLKKFKFRVAVLKNYIEHLVDGEKSQNTVINYSKSIRLFMAYLMHKENSDGNVDFKAVKNTSRKMAKYFNDEIKKDEIGAEQETNQDAGLSQEQKTQHKGFGIVSKVKKLVSFLGSNRKAEIPKEFDKTLCFTKSDVIAYRQKLSENYGPASVNSMIIALNGFLEYTGNGEAVVSVLKLQKQMQLPKEKMLETNEYISLVKAAYKKGKAIIGLVMEVLVGTGMRVSELEFLTVKALKSGKIVINLKGKIREVFIPDELLKKLNMYIKTQNITSGYIFVGNDGKLIKRLTIWREMKKLAYETGIDPAKVFPHNLRHLFARNYYEKTKDIYGLADILGHSSVNTTRIYTKRSARELKVSTKKLGLDISEKFITIA